MQEYSHANQDGTREAVEKFEEMIHHNKESYFDVFQIESIFDYYNEENMLDKAESAIKLGLRQHPDSTSLLLKHSTLLIEQNAHEDALEILEYIREVENSNAEIFLNLGIVYTRMGERKKAIADYTKALKLVSEEELDEFVFEIGFNLNQEGFYKDSRNLLKNLHPRFPNNENILFEMAYAHDKLEEVEEGIEVYNKLLNINPYLENAWYNLGILYNKQEKYTEAIEAYNITIAISPNLSEAYYNKANSLAQIGEYSQAIECYAEYMSFSYPMALTYFYMGDCWENLNNYGLASRFYKIAVDIDPEHTEALQALGRTAYRTQDYETSIFAFDKALMLDPDSSDLWLSLGKTYKKMKKPAEAKRCLKRALINQHEDTSSWIEMYQFLDENEKDFDPIPFLKRLLSKDQTNGALHYLAAIVYNKNNNHADALQHLVIARQLLPDDLEIVLNEYPALVSMPKIAEYINTHR
ncbi:tetratricopeptide repeat protein [Saccharicrinis fermentans]|uniref:TPR repeat protein YrrB n=1 Tax=Saccharicrinis fermentans DSM 9555 = JCM 21142 TaxID=869213 RepID=W7Y557_9BACT|nr:tetratricopeptide repeat protein [Saccharicrinis fermentans]GAF02683.1 TPR repeat protein YrrB [Saccharicrinis fermentans DSM 9555 = JCM 21142]